MFNRLYIHSPSDVPSCWRDHLLVLWQEDDARPADRERPSEAVLRFTGKTTQQLESSKVRTIDDGDLIVAFYKRGWVVIQTPEGGQIGVLLRQTSNPNTHTSSSSDF